MEWYDTPLNELVLIEALNDFNLNVIVSFNLFTH